MNIAIIGSGGREHALSYRLAIEDTVTRVDVIPGNPGMGYSSDKIKCIDHKFNKENYSSLIDTLKDRSIDLVIIGPENFLANGIVDQLETAGLTVLGPSQKASMLESSKVYAKKFMKKYKIPTAYYKEFSNVDHAYSALESWDVVGITEIRFHDLRATFITNLLAQGVPMAQVMSIVGHSKTSTTDEYLRLAGVNVKGSTDRLGYSLPSNHQGLSLLDFKNI